MKNSANKRRIEPEPRSGSLDAVVGRHIVHNCPGVAWLGGTMTKTVEVRDVILMAVTKHYAMVRRPRCMPYVASVRELEVPSNKKVSEGSGQ